MTYTSTPVPPSSQLAGYSRPKLPVCATATVKPRPEQERLSSKRNLPRALPLGPLSTPPPPSASIECNPNNPTIFLRHKTASNPLLPRVPERTKTSITCFINIRTTWVVLLIYYNTPTSCLFRCLSRRHLLAAIQPPFTMTTITVITTIIIMEGMGPNAGQQRAWRCPGRHTGSRAAAAPART